MYCKVTKFITFTVGRWTAVCICPCWPADRNVQIQVQADETDQNVQRSQTSHLLQIQHSMYENQKSTLREYLLQAVIFISYIKKNCLRIPSPK